MNELSKTEMNAVFPSKWKSSGLEHAEINEIHRDYKLPPPLHKIIDAPRRTESKSDITSTAADESSDFGESGHPSASTIDRKEFKWMGQHDRDLFTAGSHSASPRVEQPRKPSPNPSDAQNLHLPKQHESQIKVVGKESAAPSNASSPSTQGSVGERTPKSSGPKSSLAPPFRGQSIGKAVATTSASSTSANFSSGTASFRVDPKDEARYWSSQISASLSKTTPRSNGREQLPPPSDASTAHNIHDALSTSKADTQSGNPTVKPAASNGVPANPTLSSLGRDGASCPWRVVSNPLQPESQPERTPGQWKHVFSRRNQPWMAKWRVLCSPASLPLTTEDFPSESQLEQQYSKTIHRINLPDAGTSANMRGLRAHVARELIQWRLSEGFQVAIGRPTSQTVGKSASRAVDFFTEDFMTREGATITIVKGDSVHELYAIGKEIVVTMYQRSADYAHALKYSAMIRTIMESRHHERQFSIRLPTEIDW